ncbi:MAG: c-type cytochrome [Vicinamibacterales bacterium]
MRQPTPTEAEWEDVFRHLYSLQFSDRPAAAARGKTVFESTCAVCHGTGSRNPGPGKPTRAWAPIADPTALIHQMWTHASSMKKALGRDGARTLKGADFLDLAAYLRSTRQMLGETPVTLTRSGDGALLTGVHCGRCHGGSNAFAAALPRNRTFMDIGAALWNHATRPEALPALPLAEFREIVAYVWELQYRGPNGVAARGADLFARKGCQSCHRSPGPPATPISPRPGRTFTPLSMVALGWGSGREMHRQMVGSGVAWPHLTGEEVSHLVAFLNTLRR